MTIGILKPVIINLTGAVSPFHKRAQHFPLIQRLGFDFHLILPNFNNFSWKILLQMFVYGSSFPYPWKIQWSSSIYGFTMLKMNLNLEL